MNLTHFLNDTKDYDMADATKLFYIWWFTEHPNAELSRQQLADMYGRSKRSIRYYLKQLFREGMITRRRVYGFTSLYTYKIAMEDNYEQQEALSQTG